MKTSSLTSASWLLPEPAPLSRPVTILSWSLRLIAAVILLQTLFFKFSGAEESIYIFTRVGLEPIGRYGSGVAELIASVLLLAPRTVALGAALSIGVMAGAIFFHLTLLGISVMGDGGLLFGLALAVLVSGLVLLGIHRRQLPLLGEKLS